MDQIVIKRSLLEVLTSYAETEANNVHHGFWIPVERRFSVISYGQLSLQAFSLAKHLRTHEGCKPGDGTLIAAATPKIALLSFFATIINGSIPIIVPAGVVRGRDRAVTEARALLASTRRTLVISDRKAGDASDQVRVDDALINQIFDPDVALDCFAAEGTAYIQLSSATTGTPKGVGISHRNLVANVYGIRESGRCGSNEAGVSWLPLYHDMGLVGAEMFCFMNGYSLHTMTPFDYIKDPARWLQTISDVRATLSVSPNFGYAYAANNIKDQDIVSMELSSWRRAFNGAEPISPTVIAKFTQKFGPAGFREETFVPCYGLAESTLAVTVNPDISRGYVRGFLKRSLVRDHPVVTTDRPTMSIDLEDTKQLYSVSCGSALDGTEISIRSESGGVLPAGSLGEIYVSGVSVAFEVDISGIREFDEAVPSGDLGVLIEDELYILDRIKNIVIRNGRNYAIAPFEEEVAQLHQIEAERVAIFELSHSQGRSERDVVALIELVDGCIDDLDLAKIRAIEFPLSHLAYVRPNSIPKTTSGKKRHFLCRELFEKGSLQVERIFSI